MGGTVKVGGWGGEVGGVMVKVGGDFAGETQVFCALAG